MLKRLAYQDFAENEMTLLQKYFELKSSPSYLSEEVSAFRRAASLCFGYESVEKRYKMAKNTGCLCSGLFIVYELRNLFAHGSLNFPEPDENNQPISSHQAMVSHATRIVLLSIQMLLLAKSEHSDIEISYGWDSPQEVPLWIALSSCHLDEDVALQLPLL